MSLTATVILPTPRCHNMEELPSAAAERTRLEGLLSQGHQGVVEKERRQNPLCNHILNGLAYTVGSALGSEPPTREECLAAFTALPNKSRLTAGAKAYTKHAHRSGDPDDQRAGWWGKQPTGPVATINERALLLFARVMDHATWRNLHWLPHRLLVYEVRVEEGYGMRWSQDRGLAGETGGGENLDNAAPLVDTTSQSPWIFRGFLEPMMENGHEVGWRH
ncbi:hypothetical protein BU15DRAFT_89368 [Melanogaster broomeanus]|nr:hypothetical protein BU15DRAFT_89368 [Melanogaster broomeanus]